MPQIWREGADDDAAAAGKIEERVVGAGSRGIDDPAFANAIRKFEASVGLPQDGQVSPTLLAVLRAMRTKVATLRGGYGSTGEEVVCALPLKLIGLRRGGALSRVRAFTAVGSYDVGPIQVLDTAVLGR